MISGSRHLTINKLHEKCRGVSRIVLHETVDTPLENYNVACTVLKTLTEDHKQNWMEFLVYYKMKWFSQLIVIYDENWIFSSTANMWQTRCW